MLKGLSINSKNDSVMCRYYDEQGSAY